MIKSPMILCSRHHLLEFTTLIMDSREILKLIRTLIVWNLLLFGVVPHAVNGNINSIDPLSNPTTEEEWGQTSMPHSYDPISSTIGYTSSPLATSVQPEQPTIDILNRVPSTRPPVPTTTLRKEAFGELLDKLLPGYRDSRTMTNDSTWTSTTAPYTPTYPSEHPKTSNLGRVDHHCIIKFLY